MLTQLRSQIICGMLLVAGPAIAQDSGESEPSRFEIGLNITNVMANFFNSDFPRSDFDQYSIGLKLFKQDGKSAFRAHLGGSYADGLDSDLFGTFTRSNQNRSIRAKLGWEWHRPIIPRFLMIYGVDALAAWSINQGSTSSVTGDVLTEQMQIDLGAALFLGFRYELGKRFSITTESALSTIWTKRDRFVTENGQDRQIIDARTLSISHTLPVSLYLYFKL